MDEQAIPELCSRTQGCRNVLYVEVPALGSSSMMPMIVEISGLACLQLGHGYGNGAAVRPCSPPGLGMYRV